MKNALRYIALAAIAIAATSAHAQTKGVLKNITGNTITESLTFPSGTILTIAAGATINATGATITGFGSGGGSPAWGDITGTPTTLAGYGITDGITAATAASTFAAIAHNQAWSTITSTPTTLAGYGITDAITAATAASTFAAIAHNQAWSTITSTPTTLAGYGITDALTAATAATTYAPLASPTFTGTVTIPSGANISGYAKTTAGNSFSGENYFTGSAVTNAVLIETDAAAVRPIAINNTNDDTMGQVEILTVGDAANGQVITLWSNGAIDASGTVTASAFSGDGSALTGISVPSPGHSTLTYAATTDIDLTGDGFKTLTLTGNVTFTTSNRAAARSKTIRIIGDASSRTLTWPAGWTWVGAAAPASLAAGKVIIVTVTFFGSADTDAVAASAVQP